VLCSVKKKCSKTAPKVQQEKTKEKPIQRLMSFGSYVHIVVETGRGV